MLAQRPEAHPAPTHRSDHRRAGGDPARQVRQTGQAAVDSRFRWNDRLRCSARSGFAATWLLAIAAALLAVSPVSAEDYPSRPVRIIVPFPPAALNDMVGRSIAASLSEQLGKQFIVENRSGAGGTLGSEYVAHAPNDGYTLLIVSLASAVNRWLYPLTFDPVTSFAPITSIVTTPAIVAVNPELPAKSLKEFVALAKAKPGGLQYASSGVGTFLHLAGELFKTSAGVDLLHIPFKGAGPAMINVIGGHSQAVFASVTSTAPHVRSGKLRALAVASSTRTPALPDVPTAAEAGVPSYEAANWIGIVAPAGTPPAIVAKLHKEIAAALDSPELQKRFATAGAVPLRMDPAQFRAHMVAETEKWGRVVKAGKIKAQ
jgi:tripartite-type tricarboxylate transporter receptor subunit TctC